ncbi:uncharacterized protein LOC117618238 [Prunus dulcis]|uniref:uncharacterized protein LOC117618238 n=1 Tax=Prunus dulcis TaxID=3755 RepID=UPI0014838A21|nr:uncharacterized protein LOC117618238 [Prunus dulcis]
MAEEAKPVRDYDVPSVVASPSSIRRPTIDANNFEIRPAIISMIQQSSIFCGLPQEDPNSHISNFLEICDTFKCNGATNDPVRLRLFPFSLKEKAKSWLNSQPPNSITTWDDLANKFLAKFFPPAKIAKLRNDMMSFAQNDMEPFYEAWDRYKDMLRKCPHHALPTWMQVQAFYNGLNNTSKTTIDAAAGGALMGKTETEAYNLLEEMASNNYQWPSERSTPKKAGIHEIDAISALTAQISTMSKQLGTLNVNAIQSTNLSCEFCAGPHHGNECGASPFTSPSEQVNQVSDFNRQRNNPYSNTYNPGWKNHPNFSWSNNQNVQGPPPGFTPQEKKHGLDDIITQLAGNVNTLSVNTNQFMSKTETTLQNQAASIRNLEVQMGQLANVLTGRVNGALPSQTEINPKNQEHTKALTLRNGRPIKTAVDLDEEKNIQQQTAETTEITNVPSSSSITAGTAAQLDEISPEIEHAIVEKLSQPAALVKPYVPPIPFPQRLRKNKVDAQFSKFLDIFKKLQINIPFADALEQMPSYAKFMKDIISKKRKLGEHEIVKLSEECSAILQRKLPPKLKDLGSFTIPCTIGTIYFEKALCDLGSSINLMPSSVAKHIGLGVINPTTVSLQMADRSITYPRGIIEDVLVKVDKLIFPTDFLILDMEEDAETPIILGRPFLKIGKTLIDVDKGLLILRVADEQVTFNVFEATKYPVEVDSCFRVDIVEKVVSEKFKEEHPCDPLEACLVHSVTTEHEDPKISEMVYFLEAMKLRPPGR